MAQANPNAQRNGASGLPAQTVDPVESIHRARARIAPLAARAAQANLRTDLLYKGAEKAFQESGISLKDQSTELPAARKEFLDAVGAVRDALWAAGGGAPDAESDQAVFDFQSYSDQTLHAFSELEVNIAEIRSASKADALNELFILNKFRLQRLKNLLDRGPGIIKATLETGGTTAAAEESAPPAPEPAKPASSPDSSEADGAEAEDVAPVPGDEITSHLELARDAVVSGKRDQAAKELRLASGLIKLHDNSSSPENRNRLNSSVYELMWLANRSERKREISVGEVPAILARADLALGWYYLERAEKSQAAGDYPAAGTALDESRKYARHGRAMLDGKGPGPAERAVSSLAKTLTVGPTWSNDDVEEIMERARAELKNLDALIRMASSG